MKDSIRFDTNNQEESEMNQASQSQAIIFSALIKMNKFGTLILLVLIMADVSGL